MWWPSLHSTSTMIGANSSAAAAAAGQTPHPQQISKRSHEKTRYSPGKHSEAARSAPDESCFAVASPSGRVSPDRRCRSTKIREESREAHAAPRRAVVIVKSRVCCLSFARVYEWNSNCSHLCHRRELGGSAMGSARQRFRCRRTGLPVGWRRSDHKAPRFGSPGPVPVGAAQWCCCRPSPRWSHWVPRWEAWLEGRLCEWWEMVTKWGFD